MMGPWAVVQRLEVLLNHSDCVTIRQGLCLLSLIREEAMTYYKLPLVFEPQPEGGYSVTCPVLPGLNTEGDTLEEARVNAADALAALLEAYEYLGRPRPAVLRQVALDEPILSDTLLEVP